MRRPWFDVELKKNGYAWWYLDALSNDGRYGLTVIGFLGSAFSPHYADARKKHGSVDPLDHAAVNVVLTGPRANAWAFTERTASSVSRSRDRITIGPSSFNYDDDTLKVLLSEPTIGKPPLSRLGGPLTGKLTLHPRAFYDKPQVLDRAERHNWWPVAPKCDIEVDLEYPALSFRGTAYHDSNWGDEPMDRAFSYWNWSRAHLSESSVILYDVTTRTGEERELGLLLRDSGEVEPFEAPVPVELGTTMWGIPRRTRVTKGGSAAVEKSLMTAPFYARAVLAARMAGESAEAVHEVIDLDRVRAGWVQFLLKYKILRKA